MSEEKLPGKSKLAAYFLGTLAGFAGWVIAIAEIYWEHNPISRFLDYLNPLSRLLDYPHTQLSLLSTLLGVPLLLLMFGVLMAIRAARRREPRAVAFYTAMILAVVVPIITTGLCSLAAPWLAKALNL